ncbi:membrane-bound PQQ-dependent dehydrogenase, glucose/quinate/shikimate family, partial [Pseudoroseomonas rhizosphaerae]
MQQPQTSSSRWGPNLLAILLGLAGLAAAGGGLWLALLGGSWYYLPAGLAMLGTAWLLWHRRPSALPLHALLVLATLAWALWEAGLDWWPLAARGGAIFILGALLLIPPVTRALAVPEGARQPSPARGGGLALSAALALALLAGGAALFNDPHRIEGRLREARLPLPPAPRAIPDGEWHAYGRTGLGQRYSPLDQITPRNVGSLEVAWHYRTGDTPGQPGDPEETTFQVTPLKIGDRLHLCTPHQNVIALEADTGREVWRYQPRVRDGLALQHLTCRGLSYHDPAAYPPAATPPAPEAVRPAAENSAATSISLPDAAEGARRVESCARKLFMPTADGRLIALDPETGGVCTSFGESGQINLWANMPHPKPGGYYSTSPVVVTRHLVIIGGTVLDNVSTREPSGVIRAFDVNTGGLVWNWDPGDPEQTEPLPPGRTYTPNSPNSWSISSVDEALGLVYVPMGNQPPDQWGASRDEDAARYSSSVVALELATGRVRWVFQTVHHDLWDYDVPAQPSLLDLAIGGSRVPALVQPTKQG